MSSRLSSLLVQDGLVTAKRVADAFQRQVIYGGTLDSNLLELKAVDEDDLIHYLGRADGMPTQPTGISGAGMPLPEILEVFTKEVAERFHAVPTKLLPGGVLRVLVPDGVEITEFDELALCVQQRIEPWITLEFRFIEAMDKIYGTGTPSRYARLLARSVQAHQGRDWPPARPIDPLPRFGSLANLRLVPEPPPPPVAPPPAKDEPTTLMVAPAMSSENTAALQIAAAVAASERTTLEAPAGSRPGESTTSLPIPVEAEATATMAVPPPEATASLAVPAESTSALAVPAESTSALAVPAESTSALAVPAESTSALAVPAESTAALAVPVESTSALAVPTMAEPAAATTDRAGASELAARPEAPTPDRPAATTEGERAAPVPPPATAAAESDRAAAVPEFLPTVMVDPNSLNLDRSAPMKLTPVVPAAPAEAAAPPEAAGLDDLSVADWMSAAEWLSAANKVDALGSARSPAPAARLPQPETAPTEEKQPAPIQSVSQPVSQPVPAAASTQAQPAAAATPVAIPVVEKSVQLAAPPVPPPLTAPEAPKPLPTPATARPTPPPVVTEPGGRKKGKKGKEAKQAQARQALANQQAARTQPTAAPAKPAQPPAQPAPAAQTAAPAKPAQPAQASQPAQPVQPAQASQPAQPVQPAQVSQPAQPVQPAQVTASAEPAATVQPKPAVQPVPASAAPPPPSATKPAAAVDASKSGPTAAGASAAKSGPAATDVSKSGQVSAISAKIPVSQPAAATKPAAATTDVGKSGQVSAISAKIPASQPAAAAKPAAATTDVGKSGQVSAISAKIPVSQPAAAAKSAAATADVGKSGPFSAISAKIPVSQPAAAAKPAAAAADVGKSGQVSAISAKIPVSQPAAAAKSATAADVGKSGPFSAISAKIPVSQQATSAAKTGTAAEAGKSGPTAVAAPNPAAASAAKTTDLAEPPPPSAPPLSPPRLPEPGPKPEVAATPAAGPTALKPTLPPEPIPEPVNSGRLGELIVAKKELEQRAATAAPGTTPATAPAESAGSPVPRLGPPPRVATALDSGGSSAISIEAARELIGSVEEDRDAIFEALCRGARSRCAFAAVLTLHGEVAFGRVALLEEWLDRAQLGRIAVQLDRASPFRTVAKERTTFLGTIGAEAVAGDPLRALQRSVPTAAAVLPVLVRGRAVALLYLDDDGRELPSTVLEELKPLLADVSQAFLRIAQKSKAGGLGAEPELGAVGEELPAAGTSAWRAPSVKSPRPGTPADSQTTPLPPAVPAAVSPVPQAAAEQPTVPLRVTPPAASPSPPKPVATAAEPPRPAVPEHIHTQPTVPVAAAKAAAPAASAAKAAPPPGKNDKKAGKPVETPAPAPAPAAAVARDAGAQTLAQLIERAGNLDETAIDQLLAGGSDAARAVVAALPGPLRSRERQALGDPVGGPVYSRGPLLALALRLGQLAIEPMLARLADPSTPSEARYYLTLCLAEAPVAAAIAPLGSCLEDSDDAVRMAAVSALRSFPPSSELSSLISKLRDTIDAADAKRARFAVEALGELRVATAVPQLINLLDHEDPALVDAVGRALQTITKQDFGRSRSRWTSWWRRRQDEPRLQWLLEGLTHPSAMLRSAAQDELTGLSGDVVGYRFDQPRRDREQARKRWAQWWQRRGYPVL